MGRAKAVWIGVEERNRKVFMEVTVFHQKANQFVCECRGHAIVTDVPPGVEGSEAGMMPTELLLASLGTCAGYYARQFLLPHQVDLSDMVIKVTCGKAKNPARMTDFVIEVDIPGLAAELRAGLVKAVEGCTVHNTMTHSPPIAINVV